MATQIPNKPPLSNNTSANNGRLHRLFTDSYTGYNDGLTDTAILSAVRSGLALAKHDGLGQEA